MATKQEIIEALTALSARVDALAPRLEGSLERPLLQGSWTVHDALRHLAADARGVPAMVARLERVAQGLPRRTPGVDDEVDAYNERMIAERKHKPLSDLLREINAGIRADIESIGELSDEFLQRELPNVRGDTAPASEQMRVYLGGHPMRHLDEIEAALT
jgi:hypothetical protein